MKKNPSNPHTGYTIMGRNAYINFYLWYYNEHRGQAPVTTIAKRAGITWRKMTPQEKSRFMNRNGYPKGKMPLYTVKPKFQTIMDHKAKKKSVRKPKRNQQQSGQSKSERKVSSKQKKKSIKPDLKEETNKIQSKNSKDENFKEELVRKNEEEEEENENEDKEESEEIIARRRSIQRWMDKNHYN